MPPPRQNKELARGYRILILRLTDVKKSGSQAYLDGNKTGRYEGKLLSVNSLSSNNQPSLRPSATEKRVIFHSELGSASHDKRGGHSQSLYERIQTFENNKKYSAGIASITKIYRLEKNIDICYYSDIEHHNNNGNLIKKHFVFSLEKVVANILTSSNVRRAAFTLAEVLITLGIIGIVAAMTLPVLIANYREKEIIAKAKKNYSIAMQAFQLAQAEAESPGDNSVIYTGATTADDVAKAFSKYVKGGQLCLCNSKDGICKDLNYKVLYSAYKNKYGKLYPPAIILPDGGVLFIGLSEFKCQKTETSGPLLDSDGNIMYNPDGTVKKWHDFRDSCGNITIDINGAKKPNKAGYDVFQFTVWSNRTGKAQWDVMGSSSLFSILSGGKLKYNTNK